MKVLVLGGTRFFGKLLVEKLIEEGDSVTILTRGQTPDPFGNNVERIKCSRSDNEMMRRCLKGKKFDAVYDQICFSPDDAAVTCDIFNAIGAGKYIFVSSMYVYNGQADLLREEDFRPDKYGIKMGSRDVLSYEDGKRMAETYFAKKADFSTISVRLPIVMGHTDYTGRFAHYVSRIEFDENIYVSSPEGKMNYINADDAAQFLFWLKGAEVEGAINAANEESFNTSELIDKFSEVIGKKARIVSDVCLSDESFYPYHRKDNMVMDISKARSLGYEFPSFDSWFSSEVNAVKKRLLVGKS